MSEKNKHAIINGRFETPYNDYTHHQTTLSDRIVIEVEHKGIDSEEESNQSQDEIQPTDRPINFDGSKVSINSDGDFSNVQNKPDPVHSVHEPTNLISKRYRKSKGKIPWAENKKLKGKTADTRFQNLELNDPGAFPPSNKQIESLSRRMFYGKDPSEESEGGQAESRLKFVQSNDENVLYRNIKNLNEDSLRQNEMIRFAFQTKDENDAYTENNDIGNGDYSDNYGHINESPLVEKKSSHLLRNLKRTNAEISNSENELKRLNSDQGMLLDKVKKQYQYLMQLKENSFELQMDVDVLNIQLERIKDQQNRELEETRLLEQKKRSLEEIFEKQRQSLKRTLDSLFKQELQNSAIRQKIETTGNYASMLKEIAQFVEQEMEETRRSESILIKNDKETKHQRKGSTRVTQELFTKDKGYSTPKTHTHHNINPESYLPSNINSSYRLEDPFGTQNKKLDEILEMMKTINKVKDPDIHTFRSKDGAGDESNFHKDSTNFGFGASNLESNKQINQTFVIFNKTLMDIVKELPKLYAPIKKISAKLYEQIRTEYTRFSETKIRRLNLQMVELSKRKDSQTEAFLQTILGYFKEEREAWKDFLQVIAPKMSL
jgi:hypothetical protein